MNAITIDGFAGLTMIALERMAFVFTEPIAVPAAEVLVHAVAHALIDVKGTQDFGVMVTATAGLVREVASGMMGLEPAAIDVDDHGQATVEELASILAGELIMLLTGGDGQLAVGLPRPAADEQAGAMVAAAAANGCWCVVGNENGRLLVVVRPV
jgi:CheY-specific phosphatase CheX